MAEKVAITCPECAKQLQAPAEILGRKIRCKGCNAVFVAQKPAETKVTAKKADKKKAEKPKPDNEATIPLKREPDDDEGDGKAYDVTSMDESPRCPECANELESEDDVVCLHCGFNMRTRTSARTLKVKDLTGGEHFVWLLPGILAAVGFFLCVGAIIGMIVKWLAYAPDTNTEQIEINAFYCFALWLILFSIFFGYKSARFAIKRLILQPKPPEEELA